MSTLTPTAERVDRAVAELPGAEVDALLVTDLINLRYLTGFVGTNGFAVIGAHTRTFATDFRYVSQAAEQVDASFERHVLPRNLLSAIEDLLPGGKLRLGFETSLPVRIYDRLREGLPGRVELVAIDDLIEGLRAVKDPEEIERMRAASALADAAFERLLESGLVGRTERDVALELEFAMRRLGAERPSFEPVVAAGPHGALPHAAPRDVAIEPGQLVVIDWGAQLDGYCSDCTRTLATGEPGEEARGVYSVVLEAQLAGLEAVRAGADLAAVDATAREIIAAAGYGEEFGHGLGHGVGLAIHEDPRLTAGAEGELKAGNVVSVEPGVYLSDRFGIRIEDLVVVTEREEANGAGCEILTGLGKELREVE